MRFEMLFRARWLSLKMNKEVVVVRESEKEQKTKTVHQKNLFPLFLAPADKQTSTNQKECTNKQKWKTQKIWRKNENEKNSSKTWCMLPTQETKNSSKTWCRFPTQETKNSFSTVKGCEQRVSSSLLHLWVDSKNHAIVSFLLQWEECYSRESGSLCQIPQATIAGSTQLYPKNVLFQYSAAEVHEKADVVSDEI